MAPPARARAFFYQKFSPDPVLGPLVGSGSALRLYNGKVPAGAALPAIVMQFVGGTYLYGIGAIRIWANMLYDLKVVAKGTSTGPIEPIVDRIDDLLHGSSGTVNGAIIEECTNEAPLEFPTYENGQDYVQLGNTYRIKVQES